ncbi:uncharacterized protein IUM83_06253 [Phytophthora cinnamomi]|uniref:uncharacterized protein n=1 Tax=Phytophthora cinnamomi TaxID=4785 RepID=UPI00355A6EF4|nr:hypothetical protein IUM83_06253 [Phytophthora cinnamomi]
MEKDDFLREILNSIGDVEVVLNQPRFVGSNYSKLGKRFQQGTTANEPMISTFSRKQAGSEDGIPSLNDLAVESLLYRCGGRGDVDSEVSVRDSMLNYLTDVERFTESSDKTSQVAIADLSGLPFEQKQPSQV